MDSKQSVFAEKLKRLEVFELSQLHIWYHQQESNLYLALRRHSFYPLNYGGNKG